MSGAVEPLALRGPQVDAPTLAYRPKALPRIPRVALVGCGRSVPVLL